MDPNDLRCSLAGISGVTITPFDPDTLELDQAGLRRIIRTMEDGGIDVIVPCGGTGEYYALTEAERRRIIEITTDEANHTPVVAGVGLGAFEAVEAAHHAQQCGAAGVMVHHPVGAGIHRDGIRDYYRKICEAVDIGVVAYVRGPVFSPELLAEIGQFPNLVGVKYAVNDPKRFAMTVKQVSASVDLVWLCGTAESWAPFFWPGGATGFTSGIANFAPAESVQLRDALHEGDAGAIQTAWSRTLKIEELRDRHSGGNNVSIVKAAAERLGLCSAAVRPPLSPISAKDQADLDGVLEHWRALTPVGGLD